VIGSEEIFLISRIFAFSNFWDLFFSTHIYVIGHLAIKCFNVYLRFWGDGLKFILRKYTLPGMKRLNPAVCSPNFLKSLNNPQSKLLNSLDSCVLRMVFLEDSRSASQDVLYFLNYHQNQATFILESTPVDPRAYIVNTKLASARQRDRKFLTCYAILYFQDQLLEATMSKPNQNDLKPFSLFCEYFEKFTIYLRNENPYSILFITFGNFLSMQYYICLRDIDTTSLFFRLSTRSVHRIHINALTVGNHKFVFADFESDYSWNWDKRRQENSFYTCEVSLEPLLPQIHSGYCIFRLAQEIMNLTGAHNHLPREILYGRAIYSSVHNSAQHYNFEKSISRYVLLSYGMKVRCYQFGTVARQFQHDIRSLVEPFHILTWALLVVSTFSLCLYFRIIFYLTKGPRSPLEIHVLSVLLEQSQDIREFALLQVN